MRDMEIRSTIDQHNVSANGDDVKCVAPRMSLIM